MNPLFERQFLIHPGVRSFVRETPLSPICRMAKSCAQENREAGGGAAYLGELKNRCRRFEDPMISHSANPLREHYASPVLS